MLRFQRLKGPEVRWRSSTIAELCPHCFCDDSNWGKMLLWKYISGRKPSYWENKIGGKTRTKFKMSVIYHDYHEAKLLKCSSVTLERRTTYQLHPMANATVVIVSIHLVIAQGTVDYEKIDAVKGPNKNIFYTYFCNSDHIDLFVADSRYIDTRFRTLVNFRPHRPSVLRCDAMDLYF